MTAAAPCAECVSPNRAPTQCPKRREVPIAIPLTLFAGPGAPARADASRSPDVMALHDPTLWPALRHLGAACRTRDGIWVRLTCVLAAVLTERLDRSGAEHDVIRDPAGCNRPATSRGAVGIPLVRSRKGHPDAGRVESRSMSATGFIVDAAGNLENWGHVGHECADRHYSGTGTTVALHLQAQVALTRRRPSQGVAFGSLVKIRTAAKLDLRNPGFLATPFVTSHEPSGFPGKRGRSLPGGL